MSRPRRSVQSKNYAIPSSDDEIEDQMEGSGFDSAADSSQVDEGSNQEFSDVEDSEQLEELTEPSTSSLFPPVLSSSQVQRTRTLVTEQTVELAELQVKYKRHADLAEQYQLKLRETRKMLFENRAKVAPISRIPPELLGVIFNFHVGANLESPWVLMRVSRAWRATSLLTRTLWRGIMLVPQDWKRIKRNIRFFEGKQVCADEIHVRNCISRAGSLSLDITITVVPQAKPGYRSLTPAREKYSIELLLSILCKIKPHPRIRSLSISTAESFKLAADVFGDVPLADIESLAVDHNYSKLISQVVKHSSRLNSISVPSTSLNLFDKFKRWHQVVDLSIVYMNGDNQANVAIILPQITHLTSLQICNDALRYSEDKPLVMPFLTKLAIKFGQPFWPLDCPHLTHLTIGPFHGNSPVPTDQNISLPHLVQLECIVGYYPVGYLRAFRLPLLHSLTLRCSHSKKYSAQGMKELWPLQTPVIKGVPSEIEPVVVHLRDFQINPKLLALVLKERALLEELIVDLVLLDSEFFDTLSPARNTKATEKAKGKGAAKGKKLPGSKPGWSVGCPELKRLSLDLSFFRIKDEKEITIRKSACNFLALREKVGVPLDSLAIYFSDIRGWEQLVKPKGKV